MLSNEHISAQDRCPRGDQFATLDANNVKAIVQNDGVLFGRGNGSFYNYFVPKNSELQATHATTLWIAGLVDDEIGVVAGEYGDYSPWAPGPLDDDESIPSNCETHNRLFVIQRSEIEALDDDLSNITEDILDWPWQLGAPVLDGDDNLNNYDLAAGDRPEMHGDKMMWWNIHNARPHWNSALALPIDAGVLAYSLESSMDALHNTTFISYRVNNRGSKPIEDAYIALHAFGEIGVWHDNYVGVDSLNDLAYIYKSAEANEAFSERQPAVGYQLLQGVTDPSTGENLGATSFRVIWKGATLDGNPQSAREYYWAMENKWRDGMPITFGGAGRGFSETPVNYMFPAEPGEYWSDEKKTPDSQFGYSSYREFLLNSGPFDFEAKSTQEIEFAIIWSRGQNRHDSVRKLREDASMVRVFHEANCLHDPADLDQHLSERVQNLPNGLRITRPYPNPSSSSTRFDLQLPKNEIVKAEIFDLQGRQVSSPLETDLSGGTHSLNIELDNIPSGSYFVRISIDQVQRHFPIQVIQ